MNEETRVNADKIVQYLKSAAESKLPLPREKWLDAAWSLNMLRIDEARLYNKMRQELGKKKLEILKAQEKKNVSLAEAEIESLDEYRMLKDQEDFIYTIDESVRIAKRAGDLNF